MSEPFYEANERLRERKRIENDKDAEIERLQARIEALSGAVSYIYRRQSRPSCPICADSKEIARKALAATEQGDT